jgi:long-chain fatty acid transport protein
VRKPLAAVGVIALFAATVWLQAATVRAQGIALGGVGPVNRSMSGAATAAPIDAAGAIHWNPASTSGLESSELSFGLELLLPTESVSSVIDRGALGHGFPPFRVAGSTDSEPGVSPIPTMAWVHKSKDSPFTYGLGLFGIGGFQVNYPASTSNPVLLPQNNTPGWVGGMGRVYAQAEYFQIEPTISYAITDKLSVGIGPTVTLGKITADPLCLVAPDDADGSGVARYPAGDGTRYDWGGGFQAGVYYITDNCWHYGLSFKSQQWFEPIRINTANERGYPRRESVHFDYPMIISLGTAYSGIENWLFACDVRYFDYANTPGYGDPAEFDATGRVTGLGWKSVVSVHTGAQYRASERLFLRVGYQYNDNPIGSDQAFFNVASPLVIQHVVSTGLSYRVTECVVASLAYVHGFENEVTGPLQLPVVGALEGTSVTNRVSADAIAAGLSMRY